MLGEMERNERTNEQQKKKKTLKIARWRRDAIVLTNQFVSSLFPFFILFVFAPCLLI